VAQYNRCTVSCHYGVNSINDVIFETPRTAHITAQREETKEPDEEKEKGKKNPHFQL